MFQLNTASRMSKVDQNSQGGKHLAIPFYRVFAIYRRQQLRVITIHL